MRTSSLGILAVICVAASLVSSCSRNDSQAVPTEVPATVAPTRSAASTPESQEEAVIRDYQRYWEVYAAALYNLDPSRLSEVMTGARLERALNEVQNLRSQGRAVQIAVELQPVVVSINGDTALVQDKYSNSSHYIDPQSKAAIGSTSGSETLNDRVTLLRVGTSWKVMESVRAEGQP